MNIFYLFILAFGLLMGSGLYIIIEVGDYLVALINMVIGVICTVIWFRYGDRILQLHKAGNEIKK